MEYHSNPNIIHEQSIWQNSITSQIRTSNNRKLLCTTTQFCDNSKCCRSCTQRFHCGTLNLSNINNNDLNRMPTTIPAVYYNNRISNLVMTNINLNQIQATKTSVTRLKSRKNGNESCWRHNNFIRILLLILLGLSSSCLAVRQDGKFSLNIFNIIL